MKVLILFSTLFCALAQAQSTADVDYAWQPPTVGCSQSCTYVVYVAIQTLAVPVPPCPDPVLGGYEAVNVSNPVSQPYYVYQGLMAGDEICAYVVAQNQYGVSGPSNVVQSVYLQAPVLRQPPDPFSPPVNPIQPVGPEPILPWIETNPVVLFKWTY